MPKFISKTLTWATILGAAISLSFVVRAQGERAASIDPSLEQPDPNAEIKATPPGVEELPPPSAGELLAQRARKLDAREAEVKQAELDLQIAERKLEEKIARLEALLEKKERIDQGIKTKKEKAQEARIARMTEVTGKMPPENAALYLSELETKTAAKILSGIKSRKAAAIFAALLPSKAAEISRIYLQSGNAKRTSQSNPETATARAAQPAVAK